MPLGGAVHCIKKGHSHIENNDRMFNQIDFKNNLRKLGFVTNVGLTFVIHHGAGWKALAPGSRSHELEVWPLPYQYPDAGRRP